MYNGNSFSSSSTIPAIVHLFIDVLHAGLVPYKGWGGEGVGVVDGEGEGRLHAWILMMVQ